MRNQAYPPKMVIVNGREFNSITKAAFALGIRRTEISKAVKKANTPKGKIPNVRVMHWRTAQRPPKNKVLLVKGGKKKVHNPIPVKIKKKSKVRKK